MNNESDFEDLALEKSEHFEKIASELFEVDTGGIILQGFLSFLIASTASIGSHFAAGLDIHSVIFVFFITFLPNFGLKVIAEYIKKRAVTRGMKQGYIEGRKDSVISDQYYNNLMMWARIYKIINSATLWR